MKFTISIIAALAFFAQGILAAPAPIPEAVAVAAPEAEPKALDELPELQKRGFGCNGWPFEDDEQCHNHCKTIPGYKGGYCANVGTTCKCY
ncbi:hypothetical protein BDD12DRAFT_764133 [Trichophaea hybrida]|nr:hypothetical protein BDD12DRAFT_764133 [Trichophaea hybrida]